MRYHINKKGETAVCHAKSGNCPYGEFNHFETAEEALAYADKTNELDIESERVTNIMLQNNSMVSKSTWSETKQIYKYAHMKLDNPEVYFCAKDGVTFMDKEGRHLSNKKSKKLNSIQKKINQHYKDIGRDPDEVDKYSLCAIYIDSKDPNKMVAHNEGSGCLDGAIIIHNQVEIIEAKASGGMRGAQIFQYSTSTNSDSTLAIPNFVGSNVKEKLRQYKLDEQVKGFNNNVDALSCEECLEYFISGYRAKGADAILYTDRNDIPHSVDISKGTIEEKAKELYEQGLRSDVRVKLKEHPEAVNDIGVKRLRSMLPDPFTKADVEKLDNVWKSSVKYLDKKHKNITHIGPFCLDPKDQEKYDRGEPINCEDMLEKRAYIQGQFIFSPNTKGIPTTYKERKLD